MYILFRARPKVFNRNTLAQARSAQSYLLHCLILARILPPPVITPHIAFAVHLSIRGRPAAIYNTTSSAYAFEVVAERLRSTAP